MLLFRVWQAQLTSSTQIIFTRSLKALVLYFSISCCTLNINCVVALVVHEHLFDARGNLQNEDVNKTRRRHTGSISHHSEIQSVRVCNCVCVCVCVCV